MQTVDLILVCVVAMGVANFLMLTIGLATLISATNRIIEQASIIDTQNRVVSAKIDNLHKKIDEHQKNHYFSASTIER